MGLSLETLRSANARRTLSEEDFGGGNAWRTALRTSPTPDTPVIFTDKPVFDAHGTAQTAFALSQLNALAEAWSAWYVAHGVRPRDRVAIYVEDSLEDQIHLTALAQIGAIPVLLNGLLHPEYARTLIERSAPVGVYTDAARLPLIQSGPARAGGPRWTHTRDSAGLEPGRPPDASWFRHADDDPVVLCHTSGTTGVPKLVVWTHRQSVAGARFRLRTHPEPSDSVMLSAISQSHSGAIAFTFYAVLAGLPFISLSDRSVEGVTQAVRRYRPTIVQAFHSVHAAVATSQPKAEDFVSVREWMNTGDPAHHAHVRTLIKLGSRSDGDGENGSSFRDGLGASELGWAALGHTVTAESPERPRYLGKAIPLADVAILREDGSPAADGEVGLLAVRSESLSPGYWNDSDTYYRSKLNGYRLSGDLAYRTADGDFYHVDRFVDRIRTEEGDGFSVLMEEIILLGLPEVADCAVVAGQDGSRVVPAAVVRLCESARAEPAKLLERANAELAARAQPELALLEIAVEDSDIPAGPTGKALKRRLRERYADLPAYVRGRGTTSLAVR